jgi:hypothetical protein
VSGSIDGTIRVTWIGRDNKELVERARSRLPRELTAEERRTFYLEVDRGATVPEGPEGPEGR